MHNGKSSCLRRPRRTIGFAIKAAKRRQRHTLPRSSLGTRQVNHRGKCRRMLSTRKPYWKHSDFRRFPGRLLRSTRGSYTSHTPTIGVERNLDHRRARRRRLHRSGSQIAESRDLTRRSCGNWRRRARKFVGDGRAARFRRVVRQREYWPKFPEVKSDELPQGLSASRIHGGNYNGLRTAEKICGNPLESVERRKSR